MLDTDLDTLPRLIAQAAEPLPDIDEAEFGAMFDRFGDARVVLLGEASHGTSEFYRARAAISRRLIERHGFNIVAVEADWPDAAIARGAKASSVPSSASQHGCGATGSSMASSAGCTSITRSARTSG
jgi:hypothetical protein